MIHEGVIESFSQFAEKGIDTKYSRTVHEAISGGSKSEIQSTDPNSYFTCSRGPSAVTVSAASIGLRLL